MVKATPSPAAWCDRPDFMDWLTKHERKPLPSGMG